MHPDLVSDRTAAPPLAVEGRNCWRRATADRLAVLVDGEAYFTALKAALLRARHSVLMLGWDFDSRTLLDRSPCAFRPNTIGGVLNYAVRHRRGLRAHVLIWDTALIYSWDREFLTWAKFRWLTPRRLDYRLDNNHPLGACHHQKIVVIDDCLAFIGGLDVSSGRWDTRDHRPDDPRRSDALASDYAPFHDVMLMLSGDAAAALAELARQRWRQATGQVPRPPPPSATDPWPSEVPPLMRDVTVAIARTRPAWEGEPAVREVERLYRDMIGAARRFILLENQYFASRSVTRALLGRLREDVPPDVVIVSCRNPVAILERTAMGAGRARMAARLRRCDRAGRLRLYTPEIAGAEVKIHSKLAIVDDRMLRIGSANLNNRSMGLDTECDVLIEALGDPQVEAAIRWVRCDLLAEHLGGAAEQVERATARLGLVAGVESLRGRPRSLVPVAMPDDHGDLATMVDLFDLDRPLEAALVDEAETTVPVAGAAWLDPGTLALAVLLLGSGVLALAWQVLPHQMALLTMPLRPWLQWAATTPGAVAVVAGFVVGGLLNLPVTALLIGCGALFGLWGGFMVGLAGVLASGLASFAIGRLAGRDRVRRLAGRGMPRVVRALPRHGVLVVALLRLVPVASYTVINLVAGAGRMRLANYLLGTVMGMAPVAGAMVLFGDRLAAVAQRGTVFDLAVMCLLTTALVLIEGSLARRLARGAATGSERGLRRV